MMRGIHWGAAGAVVLAGWLRAGAVVAQTGFNGVITFIERAGAAASRTTFVQYTKGHKVGSTGWDATRDAMIVDNDAKAMMMVDPEKKQYMTMTEEDAKQMQAMMGPMMEKDEEAEEQIGAGEVSICQDRQDRVVAGVPCEVWQGEYTDEDGDKDEGTAVRGHGRRVRAGPTDVHNPMMRRGGAGQDAVRAVPRAGRRTTKGSSRPPASRTASRSPSWRPPRSSARS